MRTSTIFLLCSLIVQILILIAVMRMCCCMHDGPPLPLSFLAKPDDIIAIPEPAEYGGMGVVAVASVAAWRRRNSR